MANVLLVDDEPMLRSVLSEYLRFAGHQVVECSDGDEGLERLEHERFDVVVSDVLMPGMDGLGLCGAMRSQQRFASVAFVFVTARNVDQAMQAEMDRIGDGSVFKPFEPKMLLGAIDAAIEKRASP